MANTNLINDIVLKDGMVHFRNNTVLTNALKPSYDDSYQFRGSKAGEAIRLQVPQEFTTRSTFTANVQDVEQKAVTLTRSVVRGIDIRFSSAEMTQDNVDGFIQNKVAPAMATLAAEVDNTIYQNLVAGVSQTVALPVTAVDRRDILNAGVKLDNGLAPRDGKRTVILNPQSMADVTDDMSGLFNAAQNVSQQYRDGIVSMPSIGFNFGMSQNVSTHTAGGYDANYVVKTTGLTGANTLDIDTGVGAILTSDVFTIDNVFEVNALTKQSTGKLKDFSVTADSVGGDVIISIQPEIISTGQYKNVNSLPQAGAALNFNMTRLTAFPQSLAFHPSFAAVGFTDLNIPRSAVWGARKVEDGVSMRCIEWYDGVNDQEYLRFDILFGSQVVVDRYACRIPSF